MSDPTPNRAALRLIAAFGLLLLALCMVVWVGSAVTAQDRRGSGQKEEEEVQPPKKKLPAKKPPKEEVEEQGKTKRKPVIRVGDEDEEKEAGDKGEPGQTTELEREAQKAKNPMVRQLFSSLKIPHDVVTLASGRMYIVEPIAKFIGNDPQFTGQIPIQLFDDDWKHGRITKVGKKDLSGVDPYEHIALTKVNDFLKSGLEREPETSKKYLPRMEMLQEAEKALSAVIRFHESARLRGLRAGDDWNELINTLRSRLQAVQLDQLRILTDAKDWKGAFELASRLMEKYGKEGEFQVEVARLLAANAGQAIQGQDFREARIRLLLLEKDFPDSKEAESVRQILRSKAQAIVDRARKLESEDKTQEALAELETAEGIYPQLPGLHDLILRLNKKYPVLYVGVHDLPERMVPGSAFTDSEKQAVELMFESLVKLTYSPASGQRYETALAGDMPQLLPLGRRFPLLHNAYWSDGKLVTATDVRNTVRILSDPKWPGYVPEWADFMADARVQGGSFQINLTMRQGYLDPLSFMDFKILPLSRAADIGSFAKAPVGSGPFKLDREKTRPGEDIVFIANPYYADRDGKMGLPRIREIHFIISKDPAADFQQGRLNLLLDLPTRRLKELATLRDVKIPPKMRNRRIYFLAVNHRRAQLRSQPLRRAIAHAIDREEILNQAFRDGQIDLHRSLNGPYPRSSWACNQNLPADPFSREKAKSFLDSARQERPVLSTMSLKFPDDDPAVNQACELIKKQVQEIGITLELAPRPRRQLHREVEEDNDYDLAYYYWDFPNEAYWLWPLLDPAAANPGGRNFLGYQNDDVLSSLFRKTMTHREFLVVQRLTHDIHDRLYEQMPFIPLWQLDTHVAYHNTLSLPADIDPLLIFTDVETWKLEKR